MGEELKEQEIPIEEASEQPEGQPEPSYIAHFSFFLFPDGKVDVQSNIEGIPSDGDLLWIVVEPVYKRLEELRLAKRVAEIMASKLAGGNYR